ncbi:MAG TPA: carboxypeptidase-like regulatory domain-containing protein, partial [Gemmatimonadaceae bacterium]|nr:carboxypeptidase-like regulatory domain-containing protein [Gemmatimonadaceae bacterium]
AFIAGYCVRLVKSDRDHPTEVGLGFAAPKRAASRVDIDGILWVDTASRRLQRLEFRYVGLDRRLDDARPGGLISFHEMPNGVVFIDRWSLRLPVVRNDSVYSSRRHEYTPQQWVDTQESGGEVAQAQWPASPAWHGSLGTLKLQAFNAAKRPAVGAHVRLDSTSYESRVDSSGQVTITRLLPGPYRLVVVDSALEPLAISLTTSIAFTAARDSVHRAQLVVQTANEYVMERCIHDAKWYRAMPRRDRGVVWMIGRIVGADNVPISGASVEAYRGDRLAIATAGLNPQGVSSTATGTDGIFQLCSGMFHVGDSALVRLQRRGLPPIEFTHRLTDTLFVLPLIRDPRRP